MDLRTVSFDVPPQEILSRDSVTVTVDAVIYYRVFNPIMVRGSALSAVSISASKRSIRRFVITEKAPTRAFSCGYYRFHI